MCKCRMCGRVPAHFSRYSPIFTHTLYTCFFLHRLDIWGNVRAGCASRCWMCERVCERECVSGYPPRISQDSWVGVYQRLWEGWRYVNNIWEQWEGTLRILLTFSTCLWRKVFTPSTILTQRIIGLFCKSEPHKLGFFSQKDESVDRVSHSLPPLKHTDTHEQTPTCCNTLQCTATRKQIDSNVVPFFIREPTPFREPPFYVKGSFCKTKCFVSTFGKRDLFLEDSSCKRDLEIWVSAE